MFFSRGELSRDLRNQLVTIFRVAVVPPKGTDTSGSAWYSINGTFMQRRRERRHFARVDQAVWLIFGT